MIYVCFFIVMFYVIYCTRHVICCTPVTATSLQQDNVRRQPYDHTSGGVWQHVESEFL